MKVGSGFGGGWLTGVPEAARRAEELGYDFASTPETSHDSMLAAALAANSTEKLEIQTSVTIAFPRSPTVLAMEAWDIQHLSKGRFTLGLGSQVKGHNQNRFSVEWTQGPATRMKDYIRMLKAVWESFETGKMPNYVGKQYHFTLMTPNFNPGPIDYPRPKVALACVGDAMARVAGEVADAVAVAEARGVSDPELVTSNVFFDGELQQVGGRAGVGLDGTTGEPQPEGQRINMVTAIRRTLEQEMEANSRVLLFGEDIGPKGGVHAVTLGLQEKFGTARVFDTSLNEEGIIGRAVGMALAGLMPVPEIQFRKYSEPATEQIHDCGTMRWRTNNRFAAPMVLRIPGGFFKCGDPWHSQTNEVEFVHNPGWKVAVPSNAEDAVGLLRASLRGNDPVIFFEHRAMYDDSWARRPWPGDDFVLPFGNAKKTREGDSITIVTWGAMVPRCEAAADGVSADVIDLRTLMPWDKEAVLESVRRTRRCLIVHEDLRTGGFGAEIAAVVADEAFLDLDAPVARVTMPDIPSPHHPKLLDWAVPSAADIRAEIDRLVGF
jgi:pyruvate/2-oxoglutarate/acetoin dehydrogenase E1 component